MNSLFTTSTLPKKTYELDTEIKVIEWDMGAFSQATALQLTETGIKPCS